MIVELAPAKLNLVLQVGRRRADGLHELASLFVSLDLCDELRVEAAERDEVVCPQVPGPNLAGAALRAFRDEADLPPLRVEIDKRIPVAAGLGGGSADAAAALRAANALAARPLPAPALRRIAATVGSDVPSQVEPRHALVTGAGEEVEPLELPEMTFVLVASPDGLSTADVYAEADRIASTRERLDPGVLRELARAPLPELAARLENDLEPAALSLRPELAGTREALLDAGALAARVTGSGPTVFGVFATRADAERAAARVPGSLMTGLRPPA
jgi:4-diphosphocytidyl-2-C-methyl-D-erythritol kinase